MNAVMAVEAEELPQHLNALQGANRTRLARAEVKRRIAAGTMSVAEAMDHWAVQTMTIMDLLMAQNRWGQTRARRLLTGRFFSISELKQVGRLTSQQREYLLDRLPERGGHG